MKEIGDFFGLHHSRVRHKSRPDPAQGAGIEEHRHRIFEIDAVLAQVRGRLGRCRHR
jgi:hypothetical protein